MSQKAAMLPSSSYSSISWLAGIMSPFLPQSTTSLPVMPGSKATATISGISTPAAMRVFRTLGKLSLAMHSSSSCIPSSSSIPIKVLETSYCSQSAVFISDE